MDALPPYPNESVFQGQTVTIGLPVNRCCADSGDGKLARCGYGHGLDLQSLYSSSPYTILISRTVTKK